MSIVLGMRNPHCVPSSHQSLGPIQAAEVRARRRRRMRRRDIIPST